MSFSIEINRPISYGDGYYRTSQQHVSDNHFGETVAGSRITAWDGFENMWKEILPLLQAQISETKTVQVIELSFDKSVGLSGVAPFEAVPLQNIAVEERNGQPSLYCTSPISRRESSLLTVVVGPSLVLPNQIEGYDGHDLPCVLYTLYPGKASQPFPLCKENQKQSFAKQLQNVILLFRENKPIEAQKALFEAYFSLSAEKEKSEYWSNHVLVRAF